LGQFKIDGPGILARQTSTCFTAACLLPLQETSERDRVSTRTSSPSDEREDGYNYEIGGDYELALLGGG
jgi:hypothetical protein